MTGVPLRTQNQEVREFESSELSCLDTVVRKGACYFSTVVANATYISGKHAHGDLQTREQPRTG